MIIFVIISIAYLPLQIAVWTKWNGAWFYWSIVPAIIPIIGCGVGLAKNSNLWPLWGAFLLPASALVLGVLWCGHRLTEKKQNA
jgi:hypothetical protein